jgi:hypothetical protein
MFDLDTSTLISRVQDLNQEYIVNLETNPTVDHNHKDLTQDTFKWKKKPWLQLYTYWG